MGDSNGSGSCSKVIIVLYLIGIVLFIIGFSTDYWVDNDVMHAGLWRHCVGKLCTEGGFSDVFDVFKDDNLSMNTFCGILLFNRSGVYCFKPVCLFDRTSVHNLQKLPVTFDLYKTHCAYVIRTFLKSNTFNTDQWLTFFLDLVTSGRGHGQTQVVLFVLNFIFFWSF